MKSESVLITKQARILRNQKNLLRPCNKVHRHIKTILSEKQTPAKEYVRVHRQLARTVLRRMKRGRNRKQFVWIDLLNKLQERVAEVAGHCQPCTVIGKLDNDVHQSGLQEGLTPGNVKNFGTQLFPGLEHR